MEVKILVGGKIELLKYKIFLVIIKYIQICNFW